ncbi:monovalent cation/H(+) antiporter subunit G [Parapedobacter sp. ISTM3]|uniref:Multisubunit sodium/proton antiporter, MrpG subunit n=1 Tax=Parapedobacter luteus TaxID=623280 RepID=A0A1T5BWV0_9SPHI|nr:MULTISPECIES: monovalent cation/H(+) antiporter subunit G [Parapedobacter]MBK1442312.1 monovalent cation/H(+) antiporter subunit G [Parapedobacter sp. ISTM3]SKB51611.1 multisubunit sodium/proton antiporter, MrpG subunit [Parapedobacter luteus]
MIDILIGTLCTIGAVAILIAAIGILRMPDFYLRLSVTVKAATLGGGLLLLSAAFYFPEEVSVTTKAVAIIFFLTLTAPVAAHLIGRTAYFIGTEKWKGTIRDDLAGMYDKETHQLGSGDNEGDNISHPSS